MASARLPARLPGLDVAIIGGESGHHARPCDVSWVRSLVEQCRILLPTFVKQLGAHVISDGIVRPGQRWPRETGLLDTGKGHFRKHLVDRKGGDPQEWPADLNVRELPRRRTA